MNYTRSFGYSAIKIMLYTKITNKWMKYIAFTIYFRLSLIYTDNGYGYLISGIPLPKMSNIFYLYLYLTVYIFYYKH